MTGDRSSEPGFLVTRVSVAAMQYFVLLTWVSFRLTDFDDMLTAMKKFVLLDFDISAASVAGMNLGTLTLFSTLAIMAGFVGLHAFSIRVGQISEYLGRARMPVAIAVCIPFGFASFFLWPLGQAPFIYFQF